MIEYKVGYRSPPVAHQFQKGQSGNPKGRPVKAHLGAVARLDRILAKPISGAATTRRLREIIVDRWIMDAIAGDLDAAIPILNVLSNPEENSEPQILIVRGGFPIREE